MDNLNLDKLTQKLSKYSKEEVRLITKAYYLASYLHRNQYRQSGEPYIIHPLSVAVILSEMHADVDTLCSALLHDTLEDTEYTKEDIAGAFNPTVASLVEGVTKISKMNFSSKKDQNNANTRKIIVSLQEDVRIVIIKLADRLHNMRTLQYKNPFKQKENALETMEIFVPLAYYLGAYRIKSELEDLSFQYLNPEAYLSILSLINQSQEPYNQVLQEMQEQISTKLSSSSINHYIKWRIKNIYGIYKQLEKGHKLADINDLLALKIMVSDIKDCYHALMLVHSLYHPINEKFKDYICNPKTNMYSSLHTTVFGPKNNLVQAQIRTFEMDKIASSGLLAYWNCSYKEARNTMQKKLRDQFQFYQSLTQIDKMFGNDTAFIEQVKQELFRNIIHVFTMEGKTIELPQGSTIIDFAYHVSPSQAHHLVSATVNNEFVPLSYQLQNKDRVQIIMNKEKTTSPREWLPITTTTKARQKIKDYYRQYTI